jgi:DNA end-binding protein Ku
MILSLMTARAIGSATVSFGLVSIPVSIYSASQSASDLSFNLVHKECGSRLKQQYVCAKDGAVVPREEMAKGYEYAKGQYVLFSADELKALEEKATQRVDITEFVPAETIDPVWFDKAYYLGPDKGGDRAYRLLAKAMEKTSRWALAKYAARGKQYLVLVRPIAGGGLVMQQLHYADEIRPFSEVGIPDAEVKDAELQLAVQLTEQVASSAFHPEKYEDDAKKRVLELIEKKVAGQEVTLAPAEEPAGQIIDLMEALKASLARRDAAAAGKAGEAATAQGGEMERRPARRAPAPRSAEPAKVRKKG